MKKIHLLHFIIYALILIFPVWNSILAQEVISPFNRRIVGGERTEIAEHPWQVALNVKVNGKSYLCGGSIIAERWILTAAHCFTKSTQPRDVKAKSGATDYIRDGNWSNIEKIIISKQYDPKTHENDIALIELKSPPNGRAIPLMSTSKEIQSGQPLEVTGWGTISEGGDGSNILRKVSVPYVENKRCNAASAYNGSIKPSMMCAGKDDGGIDSCQGDSGGPLVWYSTDGAVLVGVVSWGEGCARKLKYGVYTRVSYYLSWIEEVISSARNERNH